MKRREFLKAALATATTLAAGGAGVACRGDEEPFPDPSGWRAGALQHLLPTANHRRIRLKVSLVEPTRTPPRLRIAGRSLPGTRQDSNGRFWAFDADGLEPATEYRLELLDGSGQPLCESWPLRTFPAPGAPVAHLRLLVYTCGGGPEIFFDTHLRPGFLPIRARRRLLARALSFAPDACVANGDHVYWDRRSRVGWATGRSPMAWWAAGLFDDTKPILGTANEEVLKRAFGPQIAGLYGGLLRSLPVFFLQDDHDYTENDEATAELRTFPPTPFMLDAARTTQRLYYPELLADPTLPRSFVGPGQLSESFGRLRFGRLFEALLYDCRRYLRHTADGDVAARDAQFLPPAIEAWLRQRTARGDSQHLVHMPSTPLLWTAGKWAEWYPDFRGPDGRLSAQAHKPYWPEGWHLQHDRLVVAASRRRDRIPLFLSGDLHASAAGRILRSGSHSLERNPVVSVLAGALGTGAAGFPSAFRGTAPRPSGTLEAEEWLRPVEQNGFSLLDASPEGLRISFFLWRPEDGEEAIDTLQPYRVLDLPRPAPTG